MTGSFCISIDVERAWGIWDKPSAEYFERCLTSEVRVVESLAALFDQYQVSATWALVARLLERDASRSGPEELWYAPSVVDAIQRTRTPQEIASHSYAHLYYGDIDRDTAAHDLAEASRVHRQHSLDFSAFVFPRNDVSHLDLLAESGIRVFRSVDVGLHTRVRQRFGRRAGRAANLLDKMLPIPPAAVQPIHHARGLVELPSSMLLMGRNGARRAIHPRAVELKANLGLDAAARSGGVFHLWFHPSNFYYQPELQLEILGRILEHARALREAGRLAIRTMGSFAAS